MKKSRFSETQIVACDSEGQRVLGVCNCACARWLGAVRENRQ